MKYIQIIIIIFLLIFNSSCEKEFIIDDDDFPQMLVLNGIVFQDNNFRINVSKSAGINESYTYGDLFVTDAIVKLYKEDEYIETMAHDSIGFYSSQNLAIGGNNYKIEVEKEGYPVAVANLGFKNLDNITIKNVSYTLTDSTYAYDKPEPSEILLYYVEIDFELDINDNPNLKDYYCPMVECERQYVSQNTMWQDNNESETWLELSELQHGLISTYTEVYSNFQMQNQIYSLSFEGFDTYYGGYYRLLSDELFNGQSITLDISTSYFTPELKDISILSFWFPESIIEYEESLKLYQTVNDNPYTEPVNIYSNIENGIGFVCGVSSFRQNVSIE
ncbi:MAG: DUF4249 family protein [Bacteroidales bacterium]|nr:DUF4249 family protein [Bacteroidales bacterium]